MGAELSDWLFGQNKLLFFYFYFLYMCLCVLWDCGFICMISICVADNSYKAIFFFLFITQIILIVFFCGQINHLYDVEDSVYNHFINEKTYSGMYND